MKDYADKGILQIDYNFLNLPDYVKFNKTYVPRFIGMGIDFNVNTRYLYRADGTKLKKVYIYGSGKTNMESSTITDYLDGFQYEENYTGSFSSPVLKFVPTAEGYYNFENNKYIYSYTDHLGNVRLSYTKNGSGGTEIIEENNFYPFGLKHQGYNTQIGNPSYNYQYNGKELQKETGWSDYGARMYMADIGRWGVIDPLAETSRRFTPYNYAYNNPIGFIDPDGRKAEAPDSMEGRVFKLNAPENSLWFTYANGGSATAGSGDGIGDFFAQMNYSRSGGGGGVNADDNIQSFVNNGVPYAVAVKVSNNGAISFDDYASSGNYFQGINFEQFLTNKDDNGKKALKYKEQYELNKNIQMAETILSEALLETTQDGKILRYGQALQYSRKQLVKVYGSDDIKSINKVYSILVNKLDFVKKSLAGTDGIAYSTVISGIITSLGANTLRLEIKNEYLLYQIKKLDIGVYRSIFPLYETSRFGGGGAKGKW